MAGPIASSIPALVVQDESPYGCWRPDPNYPEHEGMGYMVWESYPENPDGRTRPLLDQPHAAGSWWSGSGESMRWHPDAPAPNPIPDMVPESEENA